MSRLSQMMHFINANPIPSKQERDNYYTGISNFDELKQARKVQRRETAKYEASDKNQS